jgi:hypothetical protein
MFKFACWFFIVNNGLNFSLGTFHYDLDIINFNLNKIKSLFRKKFKVDVGVAKWCAKLIEKPVITKPSVEK